MQEEKNDRTYRKTIHKEDVILYTISVTLIFFFSYFFSRIQQQNDTSVFTEQDQRMFENLQLANKSDSVQLVQEYLKAQLQLVYKRYELSTKVSRTIAYIKFIGFLVGTLLVLLGTMLVIRGVRDHSFTGSGESAERLKFSIAISSPGVFLAFIGTAIMLATILKGIENKMDDVGIAFPGVLYKTTDGTDGETKATVTNVQPSPQN